MTVISRLQIILLNKVELIIVTLMVFQNLQKEMKSYE